jgi:DNA polymerase III epsilon subunit-like protein
MFHPFPDDRASAIERVRKYVELNPLFLDTETTGLSDRDEICEIAIIDLAGEMLINSLVKPTKRIPPSTSAIHGITDDLVKDAPTFGDLLPRLEQIIAGRTILVYNVEFDEGKIEQSATANGCKFSWEFWARRQEPYESNWKDVMELYATFYGDWNEYHHSYQWQRLLTAARQCGIHIPETYHRALADAQMTRQLVLHMSQEKPIQTTMFEEGESDERNI